MEIREGYLVEEVPSPLFRGDVCKWFQATAPDGSKGLVYNNVYATTKTTYLHNERGEWPPEDEFVGSFRGVSPKNATGDRIQSPEGLELP
jgi:hypothetical protein